MGVAYIASPEMVDSVADITGLSRAEAQLLLDNAGGDVGRALARHFDQGAQSGSSAGSQIPRGVSWEWENEGSWKRFDGAVAAELETALEAGRLARGQSISLSIRGRPYTIARAPHSMPVEVGQFVQIAASGFQRSARRMGPPLDDDDEDEDDDDEEEEEEEDEDDDDDDGDDDDDDGAAAADDDEDGDDDDDAPDHLKCPISQMLLRDPVTTADGQTYERKHITKWLKRHTTSPLTGAELASKQLTPNVLAKKAVEAYREDRDKKPAAAPAAAAAAAAPRASAASDEPPAKKARAAP